MKPSGPKKMQTKRIGDTYPAEIPRSRASKKIQRPTKRSNAPAYAQNRLAAQSCAIISARDWGDGFPNEASAAGRFGKRNAR